MCLATDSKVVEEGEEEQIIKQGAGYYADSCKALLAQIT